MKDERRWLHPAVEVREEDGELYLVPLSKRAKRLFVKIMKRPGCDVWGYCGATFNNPHVKDFVTSLSFAANPVDYIWQVEDNYFNHTYKGVFNLRLDLRNSDHSASGWLRDRCFFGGDIKLLHQNGRYRIISAEPCNGCDGELKSMIEAEWKTCNACAKVCEHQYKPGITHGNTIGYAPFCTICGRVDPDHTREPMAELAKVVNEGGVDALILNHDDGSATVLRPKTSI